MWRTFPCGSHRIHFKCRYPATLRQIASDPIVASLKLLARRGLTTRSTGHFAAIQFWAQEPSPKSAHRKVPVSSNVRPHPEPACNHQAVLLSFMAPLFMQLASDSLQMQLPGYSLPDRIKPYRRITQTARAAWPNHSLNRTLCGGPILGPRA